MFKRLGKKNITSRLKRKIFAEWQQIDMSNPDSIQLLTDAMTYNYPVQINYDGSGWRTIQPYGWNTSKDGNVLLMCYKDTGEVRSYRLDRVLDVYIDFDNQTAITNNPQMTDDQQTEIYENIMNDQSINNIDMPEIPDENNTNQQPGIYDNELSMLTNDTIDETNTIDNTQENNRDDNNENNNESEETK